MPRFRVKGTTSGAYDLDVHRVAPYLGADPLRAAAQGKVSEVLLVRGRPADAHARHWTPLHDAVIARLADAARLLLGRG